MKAKLMQDRSQQNNQTPDPVPAPLQVFPSQHAAQSFEARERKHYAEVTAAAAQQSGHAAWLGGRIAELNAENDQDAEVIARAEQVIAERQDLMQGRRQQIAQFEQEKQHTEHLAKNNWDDAAGSAGMLERHGFQVPTPSPVDVKVAPADPSPTGPQETPEQCPCGDPMVWDRTLNQYIHPLPNHKFEPAGESCQRRRDQTLTMPPVGEDAVVGS